MAKQDKKNVQIHQNPQTNEARITANGRVIADHPSNHITPAKMRGLFEDAENGDITAQHELFTDIEERDSAIAAALQTRKMSVLGLDWRIVAPRQANATEEQLSQAAHDYLADLPALDDVLLDLMDAVGHGFVALEMQWQLSGSLNSPTAFTHKPQAWFRWDKNDTLLLKTPDNPMGEPFLRVNFALSDGVRLPVFEFDTRETADLATVAEALPKLVDIGVQIPEKWVHEKLAIPEIADGERVLSREQKQPAQNNPLKAMLAALSAQKQPEKAVSREQQILEQIQDEAFRQPDFNAQLNPIVKQAVAAMMACESYEEADAALTALYPNLDNQALTRYMQQALFLSDLLGQANAKH